MKPANTKGKIEFMFDNIWGACIGLGLYVKILFKDLEMYSKEDSFYILLGIVLACCILGILFEMKTQRNSLSVFMNVISGYGIYTVLAYLPSKGHIIKTTLFIAAVLAGSYAVFILCRKIRNRKKYRRILKRRIQRGLYAGRNIMCMGLLAIMIITEVSKIGDASWVGRTIEPNRQYDVAERQFDANIKTLSKLQAEVWETLSVEEKLGVLQTVADIEQMYLGLPHTLEVSVKILKDGMEGYYSDRRHQIAVNLYNLINSPVEELVDTVAHEARHALQRRMVDAYDEASDDAKGLIMFYNARIYKEEFSNYNEGSDDYISYYYQDCEIDARRYASSAAEAYLEYIEEYIRH